MDQRHDLQGEYLYQSILIQICLQDQDDCSKRLLCELNAKKASGGELSDNEDIIAESYGNNDEVDINAESLEFDIAALLGKVVSTSVHRSVNHQN